MTEIVTVDILLGQLRGLSEDGYGDMKIKCGEVFLHEDEIGLNFLSNEVVFRGLIFNVPITEKVDKFKEDIQKAYERFYGT